MAKIFRCDFCNEIQSGEPSTVLKGYYPRRHGTIMLPEKFQEKHFCCSDHFYHWMQQDGIYDKQKADASLLRRAAKEIASGYAEHTASDEPPDICKELENLADRLEQEV